jgi:hypothetical protein
VTAQDVRTYEFRVAGYLDGRWSTSFAGLAITCHDDGTCTLTGDVADQSQLHGILAQLRDIGATILSLRTLDRDHEELTASSAVPARGHGARQRGGC